MKSLKGTKTAENLLKSFAGESQATNRYNYFSSVARKEGYVQMSNIFAETAAQEVQHGKRFYKFLAADLNGEELQITASYPIEFFYKDTAECLKAAAAGEYEEWHDLYPEYARVADEEGFPEIAAVYRSVCVAEQFHESRYNALLKNIDDGTVFCKDKVIRWKCNNCGYIHEGTCAPEVCPACAHPQGHFQMLEINY